MSEQWRTDWSRHYDQIQWTTTMILTAAIAVLLAYSYSDKFEPAIAFLGLWLTWLAVYYAASCREFRRLLHAGLPDGDEKRFLQNKYADKKQKRVLRQWPAFLMTFILLSAGWIWLFWKHDRHIFAIVFIITSIVGFPILKKSGRNN